MERNVPFYWFLASFFLVPLNLIVQITDQGRFFALVITIFIYILWTISFRCYFQQARRGGLSCIRFSLINLLVLLIYHANEYGLFLYHERGNTVEEKVGWFLCWTLSMPFGGLQILVGWDYAMYLGCAITEILLLITYLEVKEKMTT